MEPMLNPPDSAPQSHNMDGEGVEVYLPDEIVVEILSRVPAIDVVRYRSVCKKWRALTCSRNFTLLHLRRCLPMLLFEKYIGEGDELYGSDHYLLDPFWGPLPTASKRYKIGHLSEFYLCISMDGLVAMEHQRSRIYRIINPVYPEKVEITFSETLLVDDLCGVFFHPSLNEYCTLWRITVSGESNAELVEYRMLNLGSKPCWRMISNPWSHRARIWMPPILIDEYLYWVVQPDLDVDADLDSGGIMEFDIRNEEFTFIPSPAPGVCNCSMYNINLLDIGGLLSLVSTSSMEDSADDEPFDAIDSADDEPFDAIDSADDEPFDVNIWTLKDRARHLWTMSSYRINTDDFCWNSKLMALVNNELVLHNSRGFFSWNLKLCILRKFEVYRLGHYVTTHVMSLVSLLNCKSEIYVDERGEVEKNRKRRRGDMLGGVDENPVTIS